MSRKEESSLACAEHMHANSRRSEAIVSFIAELQIAIQPVFLN